MNRPGAYLRVLEPGEILAGDPVTVEDRPAHGVTIALAFRAYMSEPDLLPDLVDTEGLPEDLRASLAKRLPRRSTQAGQGADRRPRGPQRVRADHALPLT